jgi:Kef-type K+ transport system membrane component KefB
MSHELIYLLLIFALLVIPRVQRFSLPAPLTCLLFGIIGMLWLGDQAHDAVIGLLATLGISSLFLFAGLEVDLQALRPGHVAAAGASGDPYRRCSAWAGWPGAMPGCRGRPPACWRWRC